MRSFGVTGTSVDAGICILVLRALSVLKHWAISVIPATEGVLTLILEKAQIGSGSDMCESRERGDCLSQGPLMTQLEVIMSLAPQHCIMSSLDSTVSPFTLSETDGCLGFSPDYPQKTVLFFPSRIVNVGPWITAFQAIVFFEVHSEHVFSP